MRKTGYAKRASKRQREHTESQMETEGPTSTEVEDLKRQVESRTAREDQLRFALAMGLAHSHPNTTSGAVFSALATLTEDIVDREALEMLNTGIQALVHKVPSQREAAHRWHAQREGCDPDRDAITIVDLARGVAHAKRMYMSSEPNFWTGAAAVEEFREECLVPRFGERSPSIAELKSWFELVDLPKRRGGLRVAGVVARIIHDAKLLGARGALGKTVKRVDRVLKRLANPVK